MSAVSNPGELPPIAIPIPDLAAASHALASHLAHRPDPIAALRSPDPRMRAEYAQWLKTLDRLQFRHDLAEGDARTQWHRTLPANPSKEVA